MVGCPYNIHPTRDNMLMVDNITSNNILNPTSNFIVCLTCTIGKVQERFLLYLIKYL